MDGAGKFLGETSKAAALGALVGTSPLSLGTLIAGIAGLAQGEGWAAAIMFLPFLIGFTGALAGLALFGWPLTWWLANRRNESRGAYLSAGAIAGGALGGFGATAFLGWEVVAFLLFGAFGAATGAATGHFWWRGARSKRAEVTRVQIAETFG